MVLDSSTARSVSRASVAAWTAAGSSFASAMGSLVGRVRREIQQGRPPTKVAKLAREQLLHWIKQSGLVGEVQEVGGRRHEVSICMPEAVDGSIAFVLVSGSINGRSGALELRRQRVLQASHHVLERLHQRLGTTDRLAVLREVHSCLVPAVAMCEAVCEAGALHWPLVTTNGLFVCVPGEGHSAAVLVTWMRLDQLGKKWGRVADNLRAANSESAQLLMDKDFCVELLRLHSWLLRPHAPGEDLAALWWASRPQSEQDEVVQSFEASLADPDVEPETALDDAGDSASAIEAVEPGVAGGSSGRLHRLHKVKVRDRIAGIVVQIRRTGGRVVGLRNGQFGLLEPGLCPSAQSAADPDAEVSLGARVNVEVVRVIGQAYHGPHSVLLQRPEVADAAWAAAQLEYPMGSSVSGQAVYRGFGGTVISLPGGSCGWLPDADSAGLEEDPASTPALDIGQQVQLHVVGHLPHYRRFLLSRQRTLEWSTDGDWVLAQYPVGSIVEGSVIWLGAGGAVIKMSGGMSGWLADDEVSWARSRCHAQTSLTLGMALNLRVVGYEKKRCRLLLSLRRVAEHPLDRVVESEFLGATLDGIVSNVVDYGVFVSLPVGADGLLHRSEIPTGRSFSKGEALVVNVTFFDRERRRVGLSLVA